MAITGKRRSLTVKITKTLAGELVAGYPRTYYGLQHFIYSGTEYPLINTTKLATMPIAQYEERLAAFIGYVQTQEEGLDIASVQTNLPYYQP